jgi:hypothetical protein
VHKKNENKLSSQEGKKQSLTKNHEKWVEQVLRTPNSQNKVKD